MLVAFYKPYGVLSQFTPEPGSKWKNLSTYSLPKGVYAVGRLDADSEGFLLLTDEAGLNSRFLDPAQRHPREYWAQVEGWPDDAALKKLETGVVLDGALVNPVPIAPTLQDNTDLTVVVDLSGPALTETHPHLRPKPSKDNGYRKRIAEFIDGLQPARAAAKPQHGLIDVAFASMQAMQDTIAQLRMAGLSPDVMIDIPRNACGYFEFWRAEELITMGRERAQQAFTRLEQQ